MEAMSSLKTLVMTYKITQHIYPENNNLYICCPINIPLTFYLIMFHSYESSLNYVIQRYPTVWSVSVG